MEQWFTADISGIINIGRMLSCLILNCFLPRVVSQVDTSLAIEEIGLLNLAGKFNLVLSSEVLHTCPFYGNVRVQHLLSSRKCKARILVKHT